ncbi:MAG: hypothetical protein EHM59_01385 [Betaproteobacteria bacterium]|nr:MAG: hypothetical protein EHM59_01385 [Betaproteobacteria bacterium]
MARPASALKCRLTAILICAAFVLSGCGGGAVSVRSNFSGPPIGSAPPAPPAGATTPKGFYAAGSGDGNVLLAVIVAIMILDGVGRATDRIRQALADPDPAGEAPPAKPVERKPSRGPGYSWVFNQ